MLSDPINTPQSNPTPSEAPSPAATRATNAASRPTEIGGPTGLEPTRYGDWERKGRCIDF
ncbi:MAG: DUF1674 domain-containing protein [Gammaproteobacteria bacterium]